MINRIVNYIKRKSDKEYQKLLKLYKLPRYTKGVFNNNKYSFEFPDSASFVFMFKEIFKTEIYKFDIHKQDPFIIDCGANIGMSVVYFKTQYPNSQIIAFEPELNIFNYLNKNLALNHINNIELINKAVWKENTTLTFINEGADANRIAEINNDNINFQTYKVETVKLSDYINKEVDLLKIDIEGAELEVVKEIEHKLSFVKRIFIEYHSSIKSSQKLSTIIEILEKNDFHYYIDSPNRTKQKPFIDETEETFVSFDFFLNIYGIKKN